MNEKKNIVLDIEGISSIKYEEAGRFSTSVSYQYYRQALDMTEEVIANNLALYSNDSGVEQSSGTRKRNSKQLYNIIFFTGDRGVGKTSTMLSFMEFLKDYNRNSRKQNVDQKFAFDLDGKEIMFTGLEYIDASVLDAKEDILGSVLSKMLKKWLDEDKRGGIVRELDYEHKKRKLQELFSKVYECLKNISGSQSLFEMDSDRFMDNLQNMSLTFNLKQSFQELLESYLDIMKYPGAGYLLPKHHFLVVCIDDLDMNISKGFTLLEQIRKYLMIPNVIVLLSANYDQLNKICNNHYFREFDKTKSDDIDTYVKTLSREYLEKMIPVQRQIIMESGQKSSIMQESEITIKYSKDTAKGDILEEKGNLYDIVSKCLDSRLNIRWNVDEDSIRYLVPKTLRELAAWVIEIHRMCPNIEDEKKNVEYFLSREFFRICRKYLKTDEQRMFYKADEMGLESKLLILCKGLSRYGDGWWEQEFIETKVGDLLEHISALQKSIYEAVTIASLTKIYLRLQLHLTAMEKRPCLNEELKRYFGSGIWGRWESRFIGPVSWNEGESKRSIENIARSSSIAIKECLALVLEGEVNWEDQESVKKFLEENKEKIITYQYLLLFYNIDSNMESEIWTLNKNRKRIELLNSVKGTFSLSSVLFNLIDENSLAFQFMNKLNEILIKKCKTQCDEKKMNIFKMSKEMQDWNPEKKMLVPIEDVEYLVKTGECIQNSLGCENLIESSYSIWLIIKRYFAILLTSLNEYDRRNGTDFYDVFKVCPLIKRLNNNSAGFRKQLVTSIQTFIPEKIKEEEWVNPM